MSKSLYPVGEQFCVRLGCVSKCRYLGGYTSVLAVVTSFLVIYEIVIVGVIFGDETLICFSAFGSAICCWRGKYCRHMVVRTSADGEAYCT
jgi:hypothetical protein